MSQEQIRIQLRLPPEVHASLVEAAANADRSLNGEIINRLRSTFKAKRTTTPKGTP